MEPLAVWLGSETPAAFHRRTLRAGRVALSGVFDPSHTPRKSSS